MEGDYKLINKKILPADFNPLPPHGGRHSGKTGRIKETLISIHSLRMEGDLFCANQFYANGISIHSLRMEGDRDGGRSGQMGGISIHSLRMEGDRWRITTVNIPIYFNPLPPHGGRHLARHPAFARLTISIHSLRMEGDSLTLRTIYNLTQFQSTPSAWRETAAASPSRSYVWISIHSLRMEGDRL